MLLHISGTFSFEEPKLLGLCEPEKCCFHNDILDTLVSFICPAGRKYQRILYDHHDDLLNNNIETSVLLIRLWEGNLLGADANAALPLNSLCILTFHS